MLVAIFRLRKHLAVSPLGFDTTPPIMVYVYATKNCTKQHEYKDILILNRNLK